MNEPSNIWQWLLDENNRAALALVGGGLVVTVGAGWTIFKHFHQRKDVPKNLDASNRTTNINQPDSSPYVEHMDDGSLTINSGLSPDQIQAIGQLLRATSTDQVAQIAQLSHQLGISEAAVGSFFATLGQEQVPPERWPEAFSQIAQHHLSVLKRLESLPADDTAIQEKTTEARKAIESGDAQGAEALLEECELLDLQAIELAVRDTKTRLRRVVETRAARGELAMTRIDYRAAAGHYRRAAEVAEGFDAGLQNHFLHEWARALYRQGDEKGDNAALTEAIDAWRKLLERQPRERVPLKWAMTQNNLGNALSKLGARESGSQRLEQAVSACREALKEYTRERVPLNWAETQNNLGNALSSLGERENGAKRLEEAVTAYREALAVYEAAGADYYITVVHANLKHAKRLLDEREGRCDAEGPGG